MILTKRHYILGIIILVLIFKAILSDETDTSTETNSVEAPVRTAEWSEQQQVEHRATEARRVELQRIDEQLKKRELSARELPDYRQRILSSHQAEWTQFLEDNWQEYLALLAAAKKSNNGKIDCTICEGDTYLDFCFFCSVPSNGKCASCDGHGTRFGDELCPTCQGNGKCFMCNNSHQMMCPFCEDGAIDIDAPPPSRTPISR